MKILTHGLIIKASKGNTVERQAEKWVTHNVKLYIYQHKWNWMSCEIKVRALISIFNWSMLMLLSEVVPLSEGGNPTQRIQITVDMGAHHRAL